MSSELYSSFINHYNEYEKFLEEEKNTGQCCLTLFGVSGAGKSTFLSRLKSSMSPHEFYDSVIQRDKDKIVVEDVTIGRSITSVTIVPRMHNIGKLAIYDVPGFKDTDDNKRIIINILHKCLLNHVKQNKFIAVLRLDLIEEERMTQLIGDYYDSFSQLFGKNYRKNIDNVYFIITHFDKHSLTMNDVTRIMKERVYNAIDLDKDQLAYFLKRLVKKHILVDYKKDTQDSLLNKMDDLLSEEVNSIAQSDITITNLDVYENELNKKLKVDLDSSVHLMAQESEKIVEELKRQKENIQFYIKEKKDSMQKKEQVDSELGHVNEFLQNVDKTVDLIAKNNENLEYEKQTFVTDINSQKTILSVLDKTLKNETDINVRVDVSQKSFGGSHYYENIINIDQSQYKERIILITRQETNDDTLRTYIGTGGIIPDDIKKIKHFQSDIVLYNNNTCLKHNIRVDLSYNESSKQMVVSAKCDIPFKFYLYYTHELNNSMIFNKTKIHFANVITFNEQKCKTIWEQIEQNLNEINMLKLKDIEKRTKREDLTNRQNELDIKIKETDQKLNDLNAIINEIYSKEVKFLTNIKTSELYTTAVKILRIFNANLLKSSINEQVAHINKFIDDSMVNFTNIKKNIMLLQK